MKKFALAVAATILGTSLAFAQQPPPDGGRQWGGQRMTFAERFGQELGLTDAQKAKIEAIQKETREKNKAFFDEQKKTMDEMRAARDANDTAKLDALKPTMDAQRAKMKPIRDAEDARIAKVLTAEQNAKWQQLKAEMAAKRGNRP